MVHGACSSSGCYALTDEGRAELYDWMRELVRDPVHEYPQFGVALSLISVLDPVEAVELLNARADRLTKDIDETRATVAKVIADGVEWIFLVEEEYRISLLEAELRLVERLTGELAKAEYQHLWRQAIAEQQEGQPADAADQGVTGTD